jgi:hypothetical protein
MRARRRRRRRDRASPRFPPGRPLFSLVSSGVFDTPALEGLASESGSGQPELGPEWPVALFDVFV